MGLDISCGVSFSYGGFSDFRKMLAKEINIDLDAMKGFGGDKSFSLVKSNLKYLLNHSDCDGHITPRRCGKVAPELKVIGEKWLSADDEDIRWYGRKAVELAEGMEECCKYGEPLYFE